MEIIVTPHVAGATVEGHLALMQNVVEDMVRDLRQESTRLEVTERMWETIA
jgi:phosphoglycerate dehydrogenase-like enzyme